MSSKPFSLPHGASGIELGDFVIQFGRDKVVALVKTQGDHYTLHAGHLSGVIDIHRTWRDIDGTERHQTVFAMRHADLAAFLRDLVPMTTGMLRLVRRLRLGWLYRTGMDIVRGLDPTTNDEVAVITRRRPGRKRLVFDEGLLRDNARALEYLEDIWDFPDGAFSVMLGGRKIGVGIKASDQHGNAWLYWFKLRDVSRFFSVFQDRLVASALKYAIPKEKYPDYGVLEP